MKKIAILGFGVVGQGVASLLSENRNEVSAMAGEEIEIKYILDLRDFPDSPYESQVVHDFDVIENDPEISLICELMGGSHPAYEYTMRALKAGKSVVTSNKEVVANFGEEFTAEARKNGVSYRFEASCGGGIPVIDTIINSLKQNKITEVRGILNGTTNYILTKMFSFGESFETALADAQARGYAERNPDADILGHDAARKIVILTALTSGKLISVDKIHTEGITGIRKADVAFAEECGMSIKLIGRCILSGKAPLILVAPFMVSASSPLISVSGVYNAVEIVSSPLDNVMLYGRGAGAGPTASAVVSDICASSRLGKLDTPPIFTRSDDYVSFDEFECKRYLAFEKSSENEVRNAFPTAIFTVGEECALVTESMSEYEFNTRLSSLSVKPLSKIRLL